MTSRKDFKDKHETTPEQASTKDYIRKLEAENRKLKKQVGTDQNLFEYIKNAISSFPAPDKVKYDKPKLSHSDTEAVLIITDTHAEEFVSLAEMEGLSSYDWQTFCDRMDITGKKTLELVNIMRQASNIRKLHVWNLGDNFLGSIQPQEGAWGSSMPLPVAVPKVSFEFAKLITGLSAHFDEVEVSGVCGNHGRDTKKPVFKMTADRNWDMSVYLIAQEMTKQLNNIKWNLPKSIMEIVSVMGYNCLISHSGEVNMNNRVPYYPIESTFDMEHKVRSGSDKDFKYAFVGHWHHEALIDSTIHICPSMIGSDQYSRFKLHRKADPAQMLCFFTEKHGKINSWPIRF